MASTLYIVDEAGGITPWDGRVQFDGASQELLSGPNKTFVLASTAEGVNATLVDTNATKCFMATGYNNDALSYWLKLYDIDQLPIPSGHQPFWICEMPAGSTFNLSFDNGYEIQEGLAFAIVNGPGMSDTGGTAAGSITSLSIAYKG